MTEEEIREFELKAGRVMFFANVCTVREGQGPGVSCAVLYRRTAQGADFVNQCRAEAKEEAYRRLLPKLSRDRAAVMDAFEWLTQDVREVTDIRYTAGTFQMSNRDGVWKVTNFYMGKVREEYVGDSFGMVICFALIALYEREVASGHRFTV